MRRKIKTKKFKKFLKGVFAKNERGYRLTEKNKRFWSLLILLISVAPIRRKLLKTTHTEERSVHTNSDSCNIKLGSIMLCSGLCNRFNREDGRRREIKDETRWEAEQTTYRTKYIINGKLKKIIVEYFFFKLNLLFNVLNCFIKTLHAEKRRIM